MCTGAEIPAAMAAAAGSTAATTGADAAALGTLSAGLGTGAMDMGGAAGAGLLSTPVAEGMGAGATTLPSFGAGGLGMMDASGAAGELGATSSGVGAAGAPANPLSIGLGNFTNSTLGQGLGKGADALGNYNKAQAAMQPFTPKPATNTSSSARPMPQSPMPALAPQIGSQGASQGLFGQQGMPKTGAQALILKRLGLLGAM